MPTLAVFQSYCGMGIIWKLVETIKIQTGKKYEMEFFINTVPEEV